MTRQMQLGSGSLQVEEDFHLRSFQHGVEDLERAVADGQAALAHGDCREALAQAYYAARMAGFASAHYFETRGWPKDPVRDTYRPKIRRLLTDFYDRCGCGRER